MSETPSGSGATTPLQVVIDVPDGWEQTRMDGPVVLVAERKGYRGLLPLRVTVTHTVEADADDLQSYLDKQLAGVQATFGGHLLHVEASYRPEPHVDLAVAIEQFGIDATAVQRHLFRPGGESILATSVAADVEWPDVAPTLVGTVRSLRTA